MGWVFEDGDGYKKFNGKTYELKKKSRSKKKLEKKAEQLKDSWMGGINSYRITKDGNKYCLWVR